MATMTPSLLQRGKRIPEWEIQDSEGQKHTLSDYRQKSHLILLHDPDANAERIRQWKAAIEADRKQWDWLNVKILIIQKAPQGMEPGAYTIDRYGIFLNAYPVSSWNFSDLEREFLYYEAYHC
jgi:hypothetical protein